MRGECGAGLFACAGHHVEYARRESGFAGQAAQRDGAQWCVLRWLHDGAIAPGDRGRHCTSTDRKWIVPRHDTAGYAERLAQNVGAVTR